MITTKLKSYITSGGLDKSFSALYGEEKLLSARARYLDSIEKFEALYGEDREVHLFSIPGRTELSGNHTDHNLGKVIAASVDLDVIAVASHSAGSVIRLSSEGYGEDCVDFDAYAFPKADLHGTSASLIAGMVSGFKAKGYGVCAFDAYATSNVPKGSGLSSSAAFEVTVGTILSGLANNGDVDPVEIAKISKYAENEFFGKPCGLMDQLACAVGGIVSIDFADPSEPLITGSDTDLTALGYRVCIVNTGGNHADLTPDYAAVPAEMKAVAAHFGKRVLRELDRETVLSDIDALRREVGDRAVLRALHFFDENDRVGEQIRALNSGDVEGFLRDSLASGRSSFCYLQNVYSPKNPAEQGISLALCLAEGLLSGKKAAWRVHGGGFAGTIQAILPEASVEEFRKTMDKTFGEGATTVLNVRPQGAVRVI